MINRFLSESKNTKKFIGLWLYDDDETFWSGYVEDFNDEFVNFRHFSKYGKPDGMIVERIDNIKTIDFDDNYSEAMKYLSENHNKLDQSIEN